MTPSRTIAAIALALMLLSVAAAAAWKPRTYLADQVAKVDLEAMFPKTFGDWVLDERTPAQLVSPDQAAVLEAIYSQTISRTYVNKAGKRIMMSVAYGGDQSDATRAHRPEVCYPAQGFQIRSSEVGRVSLPDRSLEARRLVASQGSRVEPITYWIAVGDKIALTGTQQKLAQLGYTTRGVIPDGMLFRVSNIDSNSQASYALHQDFVAQLAKHMKPEDVGRVFGAKGAAGVQQSAAQVPAATRAQ
jgi:EpsI family protein